MLSEVSVSLWGETTPEFHSALKQLHGYRKLLLLPGCALLVIYQGYLPPPDVVLGLSTSSRCCVRVMYLTLEDVLC